MNALLEDVVDQAQEEAHRMIGAGVDAEEEAAKE